MLAAAAALDGMFAKAGVAPRLQLPSSGGYFEARLP